MCIMHMRMRITCSWITHANGARLVPSVYAYSYPAHAYDNVREGGACESSYKVCAHASEPQIAKTPNHNLPIGPWSCERMDHYRSEPQQPSTKKCLVAYTNWYPTDASAICRSLLTKSVRGVGLEAQAQDERAPLIHCITDHKEENRAKNSIQPSVNFRTNH